MEVFLTFLGLAIVVGTVGGLVLFFAERWFERRAAKRASDQELLDINEEMSDVQTEASTGVAMDEHGNVIDTDIKTLSN